MSELDRFAIERLKADSAMLCAALGVSKPGNHCPCRFCNSRDALSIFTDGHAFAFKCHSCGMKGDVFNAIAIAENKSFADVIRDLGVGSAGCRQPLKFLQCFARRHPNRLRQFPTSSS